MNLAYWLFTEFTFFISQILHEWWIPFFPSTHSKWSYHSVLPMVPFCCQIPILVTPKGNPDSLCLILWRGLNSMFCRQPLFLPFKKLSFLVHRFWRWWYRQPVERVCNIQMFSSLPITGGFWIVKLQCRCWGTRDEHLSQRLAILQCVKVIFPGR